MSTFRRPFRWLAPAAAALLLLAPALASQEPGGVRLQLQYQADYQPGFVVLPLGGSGAEAAATEVRRIIRQDLDFSDRFAMRDPGAGLRPGEAVNTALWRERGADWVLAGEVQPSASGFTLRLVLHDAVYGQVKSQGTFGLPALRDRDFRMAVHAAADEVVRWATGSRGMAASRIAFVMQGRGSKEIYLVDSDGENVQRVTSDGSIALSPAWSPDGGRIAYTSFRSELPVLYERDLATGRDRVLSSRSGINITPAYSPDGRTVAFASTAGGNTEIMTVASGGGSAQQQTRGRRSDSLSPTYSPDGSRIAFVSDRLGEPHVYVMGPGGEPRMVSEYVYGQRGYNTSPSWSPTGEQIAYASRVRGSFQIVAVDPSGGRRRLLTNQGNNEDPSWAPDGRHLVFASPDRDGGGLFVLDTVSGRVRPLLRGRGFGLPEWSPTLRRAGAR
jgi:TolB protein